MAGKPDSDDNLIAAAEAAASWARARRAKWTNKPLQIPDAPPQDEPFEFEFEPQPPPPPPRSQPAAAPPRSQPPPIVPAPPAPPTPIVAQPPRPAPVIVPPPEPLTIEPLSASVHDTPAVTQSRHMHSPAAVPRRPRTGAARRAPIPRWVQMVGVAAALIVVAVVVGPYALGMLSNGKTDETHAVQPRRTPPPALVVQKPLGALSVTSTPSGAQVVVDGKPRGVTPLQLTDLSPGRHEVALTSDAGVVHRSVTVAAGKTATIDEAIFSGWIAVYSPFEITVAEGGRVMRPDDRNQIMLPPGAHTLRFVNKTLGYDESREVDVTPGEGTPIRLTPAPSRVTVTASEPAEVWIDGSRIGEAPLNGVGVALGTHEIVVRRAAGGERRFTVSIGVAPYQLHVDFSQPGA